MVEKYRSVFISDIHLGTKETRDEDLLDFLDHIECQYLYLVGDTIDGWALRRGWYWPQSHLNIIRKILGKAKKGTKILLIVGNHDEFLRDLLDHQIFGNIRICDEVVHRTANGRMVLVMHGDKYDISMRYSWLTLLSDRVYSYILFFNRIFNKVWKRFGFREFSLANYIKSKSKLAIEIVCNFKETLIHDAYKRGLDGVICGHVHEPEIIESDEYVNYYNCGDWVGNTTALVEDYNGNIDLIEYEKSPVASDVPKDRVKGTSKATG